MEWLKIYDNILAHTLGKIQIARNMSVILFNNVKVNLKLVFSATTRIILKIIKKSNR